MSGPRSGITSPAEVQQAATNSGAGGHGRAAPQPRTSSSRTGRCSCSDRVAASAIQLASRPVGDRARRGLPAGGHGQERRELDLERRREPVHEEACGPGRRGRRGRGRPSGTAARRRARRRSSPRSRAARAGRRSPGRCSGCWRRRRSCRRRRSAASTRCRRRRRRRRARRPGCCRSAYTSTTSRPVTQRTASKSWMAQSRKMPPEPATYAAGGGAGSIVVERTVVSQPSSPASDAALAATKAGSKRRGKPICTGTPGPLAPRSTRSGRPRTGPRPPASRRTWGSRRRPRPAAAPRCVGVDDAITTPSSPQASSASASATGVAPSAARGRLGHPGHRVGDDELVDLVVAAQGVGVERPDPAEPDESDAHVLSFDAVVRWSTDRRQISSVRCRVAYASRASATRSGCQSSVQRLLQQGALGQRGQPADVLVEVEVAGERVALGGAAIALVSDDRVGPGGATGPQHGVDRLGHLGPVDGLHRPAERRAHLEQVRHPLHVGGDVVAGPVEQRRVEERGVALRERQLDVALGEERPELRQPPGQVAGGVLVGVGQVHRRTALHRHVGVGDRTLQGQHRGEQVDVGGVAGGDLVGQEAEVVVAVRVLGLAAGADDVDLGGHLVARAEPGAADQRQDVVAVVVDEGAGVADGELLQARSTPGCWRRPSAKWSLRPPPATFSAAMISSNAAVARSTTAASGNAPLKATTPGPRSAHGPARPRPRGGPARS